MPLLLNQYENTFRLALWSLTEPLQYFEEKVQLSPSDQLKYAKMNSESRKKEWLAARHLLKEVLGFRPQITYTETGKPLLQNHIRHLSISHSKLMVGILLCTNPFAGIDIEHTNRSIDKVAKRFLSEKELLDIEKLDIQFNRILYWCAKEAIFKAINESNVSFSKQIAIDKVVENNSMVGHFVSDKEHIDFVLNFIDIENHVVVWTT